jgi:hypothetical protein
MPLVRIRSMRTFGYGRYGGYGYGGYYGDSVLRFRVLPVCRTWCGPRTTVVYPPMAPSAMVPETAHPVIHEYTQPEDYGTPPAETTAIRSSI